MSWIILLTLLLWRETTAKLNVLSLYQQEINNLVMNMHEIIQW